MGKQFEKVDFHLEFLAKDFDETEPFAYWIFSARVWLAEQYLIRAAGVPLLRGLRSPELAPHLQQTSPRQ